MIDAVMRAAAGLAGVEGQQRHAPLRCDQRTRPAGRSRALLQRICAGPLMDAVAMRAEGIFTDAPRVRAAAKGARRAADAGPAAAAVRGLLKRRDAMGCGIIRV